MSFLGFLLLLLCLFLFISPSLCLSEAEALLAFKKSLSNSSRTLVSWNPNSDPCTSKWQGVFCGKGQDENNRVVIRLHLQNLGLSGSNIDVDALSELKFLISFSIMKNSFEGHLPPFNKLKGLKSLYVDSNKFFGEIPENFFDGTIKLRRIWFSNNGFSGKIPETLGKLQGLTVLHLEDNKFSGNIPKISQKSLKDLNLSGNNLEGKVPESMERFGANAFKGNSRVCGKLKGMECKEHIKMAENPNPNPNPNPKPNPSHAKATIIFIAALVGIMMILLLVSIHMQLQENKENQKKTAGNRDRERIVRARNNQNDNNNNNDNDVVEVLVQGDGGPRVSSSKSCPRKSVGGSEKGISRTTKKDKTDLTVINDQKGLFCLADLMKAEAEVLSSTGGLGSSYKAMMSNGTAVVVKRIRGMNQLEKDEFDEEIKKFGKLNHKNILTPLAFNYRKEEKLLVSEYISKGSLLYVLHGDKRKSQSELNWSTRLKIIKGIANGMSYLHKELQSYDLFHGNLKSSNVLLDDDYEPKLCDYGFCRMFPSNEASQRMFAYKAPEACEKQQISSKCDMYCLGILILEVLMRKLPSQYNIAGKEGTDVVQWAWSSINEQKEADIIDPRLSSSTDSLESMIRLLHIGAVCCQVDPDERPKLEEVITRIEEIER